MQGLHILAELHDCRCGRELLHQAEPLQVLCREACTIGSLTIVAEAFHGFGTPEQPAGATGAVVLAESHLAIHTWPELGQSGAVTLDLYVCNFSRDNRHAAEQAFEHLVRIFQPDHLERRDVLRGALSGKPSDFCQNLTNLTMPP